MQTGVMTVDSDDGKIKISQLNRNAKQMLKFLVPKGYKGSIEKFLEDN